MSGLYLYKAKASLQKNKIYVDFIAILLFILIYKMEFYKLNTIHNILIIYGTIFIVEIFKWDNRKVQPPYSWIYFNIKFKGPIKLSGFGFHEKNYSLLFFSTGLIYYWNILQYI